METEAFENGTEKSVICCHSISVFGRFNVDDMRKPIKKYGFTGQVKTNRKRSVGEIFRFVFVESITYNFKKLTHSRGRGVSVLVLEIIDSPLIFSGLTYQELEDKVEGAPRIVVIWK